MLFHLLLFATPLTQVWYYYPHLLLHLRILPEELRNTIILVTYEPAEEFTPLFYEPDLLSTFYTTVIRDADGHDVQSRRIPDYACAQVTRENEEEADVYEQQVT